MAANRDPSRGRPRGQMYDAGFYDRIRPGVQESAAALVPVLLEVLGYNFEEGVIDGYGEGPDGEERATYRGVSRPPAVIDVGCGEGWWAQTFADVCGARVCGIDGAYVETSPLGDLFMAHDLAERLPDTGMGPFDIALSLEVAEHLPESRAATFVADLCALAPVVIFSAAIPRQGGDGHVNLQWPDYWADLFAMMGYQVSGALRLLVWRDDRIAPWYRNNLLLAVSAGARAAWQPSPMLRSLFDGSPACDPLPLIHPDLHLQPRR